LVYDFPLTDEEVVKITTTLEEAAKETGYWEEDKLQAGDQIIENRRSMVAFSALGQRAGTTQKYEWDPDTKKRQEIVKRAVEKAPEFQFEIGGTTSINAFKKGMNKEFGMTKLLEVLKVEKKDILYFGDMTQPGGNDYPVVKMGIDTITVRSHEDTAYALRGILGVL
ncbi:HAD-IIB family hydrolase, partial [Candidatus Saccharibacteria bacterium]|nr:HAD-IIB family hydrolase [Candidatus Saccharibacteria bacterium]